MRRMGKIPAWQLTKVRNNNDVIAKARNECRKVHFASLMDLCHLQECGVGTKTSKIQRSSGAPRCEEVEVFSRVHLLSGEVRSVTTALKVVEEVQEEVQEIEDE